MDRPRRRCYSHRLGPTFSRNVKTYAIILGCFLAILAVPFLLRNKEAAQEHGQDTVVIVTPHNEAIKQEFAFGFRQWYKATTGRTVNVDYRNIGGTSEIVRYLDSAFLSAFRNYWENTLGNPWSKEVEDAALNTRIPLDDTPANDTPAEAARRAFITSNVSSGLDLFFGGGSFDFIRQMQKGQFVNSGILHSHPEFFGDYPEEIPTSFAGEPFYDKDGLWFGTVLSSFGIIFNRDSLQRLGIEHDLASWADLAHPRLFGEVALADPTKSGSANKAYEMIFQEILQRRAREQPNDESAAVRAGWAEALQLLQRIAANARYFTDAAGKPNIDTSLGDCAAGMSIDFYGRYQAEVITERSGRERFSYVTPSGGSTVSVDPIALLRGAPNSEAARRFIEFVLSPQGQALWNFKTNTTATGPGPDGTPITLNGPKTYALRRPPIAPYLYDESFQSVRSDPSVNPYKEAGDFFYRADWTASLFGVQSFLIRVAYLDLHHELKAAWGALIASYERTGQWPQEALDSFNHSALRFEEIVLHYQEGSESKVIRVTSLDYDNCLGPVREILSKRDKILEVKLARGLSQRLRANYLATKVLADQDR